MFINDNELIRYSRHILLPNVGFEGQARIKQSTALIVGLGGLGSSTSLYLASSGIGKLILCDFDDIDESNLQRQIAHRQQDIGVNKAVSAQRALQAINPDVLIDTHQCKLTESELVELGKEADVIIDCSDNFNTRYLLNRVSLTCKKPLVSGAAIRTEGQLSVFNVSDTSPCYQCLYDDPSIQTQETCSNSGVFAPLVGIIGSMQANETLKLLSQSGQVLDGKLYILDSHNMQSRSLSFSRDPSCPMHGHSSQ